MRGKPPPQPRFSPHLRNIPAYAGKTTGAQSMTHTMGEHPRVCGENKRKTRNPSPPVGTSPRMRGKLKSYLLVNLMREGTSPRMRGKLDPPLLRANPQRNIPAYAGKTA